MKSILNFGKMELQPELSQDKLAKLCERVSKSLEVAKDNCNDPSYIPVKE